jgi:Carbohydrate family 9 binding domain-like
MLAGAIFIHVAVVAARSGKGTARRLLKGGLIMRRFWFRFVGTALLVLLPVPRLFGQEKPVVGLIPKAQKPVKMNGRLDDFDGAFVTPVHVGHPDFLNRGGEFLFLWDEKNLYIGMRCLDQKPAHVGNDMQIWNGDAVEFYLDTRRGDKLGAREFGPGTLHMFYTAFTGTEVKPRMQVRDLPALKDFKLEGAEVAGEKTATGYTAVFKLPWALFPDFKPKAGEIIGIDCELCSSDGGPRVDRTFVYSGPTSVGTPSTFGRVQLVDKIDLAKLKPYGKVLLPMSLTRATNYGWMYGNVILSPTIASDVKTVEGKLLGADGKVKASSSGAPVLVAATGFSTWAGKWEVNDLPHGFYTLEVTAKDKDGKVITQRTDTIFHGDKPAASERPRE